LSERFEYIFGSIATTPIHDPRAAVQLGDLVKIEAERGELDFHQKVRAVEIFYRYLRNVRNAATTPFNDGPYSGAEYVLNHIGGAIEQTKNPSKGRMQADDVLDF